MFEARLISSGTLKKVLDSIKDLLNEATFDCSDSGIQVSFFYWMFYSGAKTYWILLTAASHGQFSRLPRLSQLAI